MYEKDHPKQNSLKGHNTQAELSAEADMQVRGLVREVILPLFG